jgi:hypothetical protein
VRSRADTLDRFLNDNNPRFTAVCLCLKRSFLGSLSPYGRGHEVKERLSLRVVHSAGAKQMDRNGRSLPVRHSRAGGNLGIFSWIPGLAPLARNAGLLYELGPGTSILFLSRSVSDEAISRENKDCFAALAMTLRLNFSALPLRERDRVRGKRAATSLLIQTKNAVNLGKRKSFCHGDADIGLNEQC